ncbi:MAG: flagellar motor switch protein FliN [Bacillota bacterium]
MNDFSWDDTQIEEDAVPQFDLTPEVPEPAQSAVRSSKQVEDEPASVQPVQFMSFDDPDVDHARSGNLDLLMDVPLPVMVELGRTSMLVKDIMSVGPGSIIELDKAAGENVDILINGRLIARGEVVVIEENFGVRIVEFVKAPEKAVKQ